MIPRSRDILAKGLSQDSYWNEDGVFNITYVTYLKSLNRQFLKALKVEFKNIKVNSLMKVVYCGKSDVAYLYMNDKYSCVTLMQTLNDWLLHSDPTFKGTTLDIVGKCYVIELNYLDDEIIKRNKQNNLKLIAV